MTLAAIPLIATPLVDPLALLSAQFGRPQLTDVAAKASTESGAPVSSAAELSELDLAAGERAMEDGQWFQASLAFDRASALDPENGAILSRSARAVLYLNRSSEALDRAKRAQALDPASPEISRTLALVYDWNGEADRALATARRAVDLDPRNAEGFALLAEAYTDAYRLTDADQALSQAQALNEANPEIVRVRAYLYEARAEYPSAISEYRRALETAPLHSYLQISLGHALRTNHQYDEARAAFSRAAELCPQDPRPLGGLGMISYAIEDYGGALGYLRRSVTIDPLYANGYAQMGWVFYVQRQYDQAAPNFERAISLEKDPGRLAQYYHALGWVNLNTNRLAQARSAFEKALELNPQLAGAREGLRTLQSRGG